MADIGADMRTYIIAQASVSTLIDTRMYPDVLPQTATLPAVVYRRIDTTLHPALTNHSTLEQARIAYDCYATTRDAANTLAAAIKACGIKNLQAALTTFKCRDCTIMDGDVYDVDPPDDGSDEYRYITGFDVLVSFVP